MTEERNSRKTRVGLVVSDKMDKTVVVTVEDMVKHPLYGKIVKKSKKFKAHDENNECKVGDKVMIVESQPLSKEKRWVVQSVIKRDEKKEIIEEVASELAEAMNEGAQE